MSVAVDVVVHHGGDDSAVLYCTVFLSSLAGIGNYDPTRSCGVSSRVSSCADV